MTKKEGGIIRSKLREHRKSLGFTQQVLASKLGVTKATYNNIELGKREGRIETWLKIQEVLCLTSDELVEAMKQ